MLADCAFQLFIPSVQVVETDFEDHQITVFKYFSASIYYNIKVVKTYWIKMPLLPIRGLNLSIPNPSNFSVYDGSKHLPWEKKPFAIKIETDPSVSYSTHTDSGGKITFINIMPINGSLAKPKTFIKLTYNDALRLQLISTTQPVATVLQNGSTSVTISLVINNTKPKRLYSSEFALFSVQDYGNLTSYTLFENGTEKISPWHTTREQWLWTTFSVEPHSFVNMTFLAVFGEKSNEN